MKKFLIGFVTGLLLLGMSGLTQATPMFDAFGQFDAYTGGGSGIPNDAVATSEFTIEDTTFTIGLTATQRYTNPALTNDGAGTFTALSGTKDGYAKWNFGFFVDFDGGYDNWTDLLEDNSNLVIDLSYDIDPSTGNDFGVFHLREWIGYYAENLGLGNLPYQGSENLLFSYLYTDIPDYLTAPTGSFNPNVKGTYNFKIDASLIHVTNSPLLKTVSIDVNVVPEPATMLLFGIGLLGLAGVNRKKQ